MLPPVRNVPASAPRARHPKLAVALSRLAAAPPHEPCNQAAPPELVKAIHEFNERSFFEQHETLELLWRATPGEVRFLYEGILQVGVGLYHLLEKRNFHGASVKLDHGIRLLKALPVQCQGVDVLKLCEDAQRARRHLLRLGPDRMDAFDQTRIPVIHVVGASRP